MAFCSVHIPTVLLIYSTKTSKNRLASLGRRGDDAGRRTTSKEAGLLDRRGGGVEVGLANSRLVEVGLRGRSENALCGKTTDVGGGSPHRRRTIVSVVSAGHVERCDESVDVRLVAVVVAVVVIGRIDGICCSAHQRQFFEGVGAGTEHTATPDVVGPAGVPDHNLEGIARLAAVDVGRPAARPAGRPTGTTGGISSRLGKCSGITATDCDFFGDIVGSALLSVVVFGGVMIILSKKRTDAGIADRSDPRFTGRCRLLDKIKRRSATGLLPERSGRIRGGHSSGRHVVDGYI